MNVLLPTVDYVPQQGGVARYLDAIKKTFPEDIDVLYWNIPIGRLGMLKEILSLAPSYRQVWTSHILPIGTLSLLTKFITRTPYTLFLHGMDFDLARRSTWKSWLTKRIIKNASNVVVNSDALGQEVFEFSGKTTMTVYPTIADHFLTSGLNYNVSDRSLRNRGPIKLLTVSRLVERKGHERVLLAIKDLPNVEYTIVGEGPYKTAIRLRIKDLGLEHRVKMVGAVSDETIIEFYKNHDIFVMPTTRTAIDREGFGIVYLEAQLFGMPVIASNHPGVDEAVLHRKSGILIDDINSLRSALNELITDTQLRNQLGGFGRARILDHFTREKQCIKLAELL